MVLGNAISSINPSLRAFTSAEFKYNPIRVELPRKAMPNRGTIRPVPDIRTALVCRSHVLSVISSSAEVTSYQETHPAVHKLKSHLLRGKASYTYCPTACHHDHAYSFRHRPFC